MSKIELIIPEIGEVRNISFKQNISMTHLEYEILLSKVIKEIVEAAKSGRFLVEIEIDVKRSGLIYNLIRKSLEEKGYIISSLLTSDNNSKRGFVIYWDKE